MEDSERVGEVWIIEKQTPGLDGPQPEATMIGKSQTMLIRSLPSMAWFSSTWTMPYSKLHMDGEASMKHHAVV